MTDDQLAKLAVAREKALVVRRAQKVEKLKAEAARLEAPSQTEEVQPSAGDGAAPVTTELTLFMRYNPRNHVQTA